MLLVKLKRKSVITNAAVIAALVLSSASCSDISKSAEAHTLKSAESAVTVKLPETAVSGEEWHEMDIKLDDVTQ